MTDYPNDYVRDLATARHIRRYPDLSDRERSVTLGVSNSYVGKVKRRMAGGNFPERSETVVEPAFAVTSCWTPEEWREFRLLRDASGGEE